MIDRAPTSQPAEQELVAGVVVSIDEERIHVRLESGAVGVVLPSQGRIEALLVGDRAVFRIVATAPDGSPTLAFSEDRGTAPSEEPFDREVIRLHDALANRRPANSVRSVEHVQLGEEQIRTWIHRVEEKVARLRKNRAKRLNEEFYNG
jgi:hypothetical protein